MAVGGIQPEHVYLSHSSKFDHSLISMEQYACFYATNIKRIGTPNEKHFLIALPGKGAHNADVLHWFVGRLIESDNSDHITVEILGKDQVNNGSSGQIVNFKKYGNVFDPRFNFRVLNRNSMTIIRTLRANVPGNYDYYRTVELDVVCICIQPHDTVAAFK